MVSISIFNIDSFRPLPYFLLMYYYLHHISVQPSGLVFLSGGHHLLSFILHMRAGSIYVLSRSPTPTIPNLIIQVLFTLSKDRLTRIKFGMLYYNLKFDYLEPRITIIHWIGMWFYDIIYLLKTSLRNQEKRGGEHKTQSRPKH